MTNRIDGNNTLANALSQLRTRSSGSQATGGNISPVGGISSLNLTESAAQLNQLVGKASGGDSSFDVERVNAIRTALANGSYQADPANIADRLLAQEHDLSF